MGQHSVRSFKLRLFRLKIFTILLLCAAPALAVPDAAQVYDHLKNKSYLIRENSAVLNTSTITNADAKELNKLLQAEDRYARYTDASTFSSLKNLSVTKSAGVGMDLIYDREGHIRCIPYKDSPADSSGVEYKDILLEVDYNDVSQLSLEDVAALIRGQENTLVTFKVKKQDGTEICFDINRTTASYPEVEMTSGSPETIKINRFSAKTSALFARFLKTLKSPPHKRIFIDLRGNTGGVLEEGAKCAGMFLSKGEVLFSLRTKSGVTVRANEQDGLYKDRKVIILMDDLTASASELMISAMKNNPDVGTYGTVSAGKGYIQDVFSLDDGAVIKFTTGELLFRDSDTGWEGRGITPDVLQK